MASEIRVLAESVLIDGRIACACRLSYGGRSSPRWYLLYERKDGEGRQYAGVGLKMGSRRGALSSRPTRKRAGASIIITLIGSSCGIVTLTWIGREKTSKGRKSAFHAAFRTHVSCFQTSNALVR